MISAGIRALIVVPTRELATQVGTEVRALCAGKPFRVLDATGGHAVNLDAAHYGWLSCT